MRQTKRAFCAALSLSSHRARCWKILIAAGNFPRTNAPRCLQPKFLACPYSHKPVIRAVGVLCPKWVGEVNGKLGAIDFVYLTICHSDCFNCVGKTVPRRTKTSRQPLARVVRTSGDSNSRPGLGLTSILILTTNSFHGAQPLLYLRKHSVDIFILQIFNRV